MKNVICILLIISNFVLFGQWDEYTLSGKIIDDKNEPLPFATISIANTNKGTNANEKGEFELKLKEGNYQIIVQYLGYKRKEINIQLTQNQKIIITMHPEQITLSEVVVNAKEDPAYAVIRNAIKTRKKHYQELNKSPYECSVYIKGVQKLEDLPDRIFGMKVETKMGNNDVDKGIFYLSETKSQYYFTPPNNKKEIIKASRVSGESKGFSFNRYIPMQKNIYENSWDFSFISNRPFISPISENALLFYKYKMIGTFYENGHLINKIEVFPKSSTDPCVRGFIYIEENTWRVHSYDFYVTKEAKLNFIDTLWLKQMNTKINDSLYFPTSIQYIFNFNLFGIKGSGYFIASVTDYNFLKADSLPKNFFKNEMVKFEQDAIKNDSNYWNAVRPIPLSSEERRDYIKKDSIEKITTSPCYLDSLDKIHNKFRFGKLFTGYAYRSSKNNFKFNVDGVLNAGVQYNTIEGINISLNTSMNKQNKEETKSWFWVNNFRYGIANQLFGYKTNFEYADNPFNFRKYGLSVRYYVEPYNHNYSISEIVNTAYTLSDYRNYLKLYLKKSIEAYYRQEILNGLYLNFRTSIEERSALKNTYSLKVFDHKNYFTSNNPLYPYSDSIQFPTHSAFLFNVKLKYNIKQRYTTYPNQKYVWRNKYPTLYLEYTRAIPFNNSMVDYDLLQFKIKDKIDLRYFGDLKWEVNAGKFLTSNKMYFMDYQHFAGNQTIILNNWNTFRVLNYFNFSTNDYFFQAHSEYNLNGLLIGKLPLLKKFKLEEVITAHYLYNSLLNNYFECSFGIDKIFYVVRIEYALAYYPFMNKPLSQFLIGFNFLNKMK